MKGTFFSRPIEWNIETFAESWGQGGIIEGKVSISNHSQETISMTSPGVALSFSEIKKVHAKDKNAFKPEIQFSFPINELGPAAKHEFQFNLVLPANTQISDKKKSYYLTYGQNFLESSLQLKIDPNPVFLKIIPLFETFYRFKIKEIKSSKSGVEFEMLPPGSKEFSQLEQLTLGLFMEGDHLGLDFNFILRKLDFGAVSTKMIKEKARIHKQLSPKEYLMGKEHIHQDQLLKNIESIFSEIKVKNN